MNEENIRLFLMVCAAIILLLIYVHTNNKHIRYKAKISFIIVFIILAAAIWVIPRLYEIINPAVTVDEAEVEELETAGQGKEMESSNPSKLSYEISYSEDEIILEYLFPELRLDQDGQPYMPDLETDYTGYSLPLFAQVLALPKDTAIKDVKTETSDISYVDARLEPQEYLTLDGESSGGQPASKGQYATYSEQDQFGWQLMYLQIHPVQYLADREELAYVGRIKVTVSLEHSQWEDIQLDEMELDYLDSMVDNGEILKQETK